jgi:tetrahydromethanopterin S-methyltransferase subunit B
VGWSWSAYPAAENAKNDANILKKLFFGFFVVFSLFLDFSTILLKHGSKIV